MVALYFSQDGQPEEQSSAAQSLFNACQKTAAQGDFDFETHSKTFLSEEALNILGGTEDDKPAIALETEVRVSGENSHSINRVAPDDSVYEFIQVGDVAYGKGDDGEWEIRDPESILALPMPYQWSDYILCPHVDNVERVSANHYRMEQAPAFRGDLNVRTTWSYWLNKDGLVEKIEVFSVRESEIGTSTEEVTTTISGFGEPNTIEVPIP